MNVSIFTDGASRGNPGRGGWGSIIVYGDQVKELGGAINPATNNQMELRSVIEALDFVADKEIEEIEIYADSSYVIKGSKGWINNWKNNGWKTKTKQDVSNRELWEELSGLLDLFADKGIKISWKQVEGHAGIAGNERCDQIATSFADGENVKLYEGSFDSYGIPVFEKREKKVMYISMVDGVVETHNTWEECKKRVEGKKGVKYKKVFSDEEKEEVVRGWKN